MGAEPAVCVSALGLWRGMVLSTILCNCIVDQLQVTSLQHVSGAKNALWKIDREGGSRQFYLARLQINIEKCPPPPPPPQLPLSLGASFAFILMLACISTL